jgi:glycosyltransferase involved in cell wall biosynthesis
MYISIIIPIYNSEETIIQSFGSVYSELHGLGKPFEVILVNDGSTDSSLSIIQKLAKAHREVVVISQENGGASRARNAGLDAAGGEIIGFNDSDDIWVDGSLEFRLSVLDEYESVDCVVANHDVDKQSLFFLKSIKKDIFNITLNAQMFKCYFSPPTALIRRKILDNSLRFNPILTHAEEGYFFNHVAAQYICFFINKQSSKSITQKMRYGESGLSGSIHKMECGELFNLKNAYKELHHSSTLYTVSVLFSLVKYLKRVVAVSIRRNF